MTIEINPTDSRFAECPVCGHHTAIGLKTWHRYCKECDYESSDLAPTINDAVSHGSIDEEDRELGLLAIRLANFKSVLELIAKCATPASSQSRLLDVGCAHGWFLQLAAQDHVVLGIEPDAKVFEATSKKGLPVREGYFPDALHRDEKFNVIVFNDVLEHIPDIHTIFSVCHDRLRPGGLLVLNLPNSIGLFYRVSKQLARIGWPGPFERLWQKGFPSPHVHYFNADNLTKAVSRYGFRMAQTVELPSIQAKGMLSRMRFDKKASLIAVWIQYLGTMALLPLTRIFASDVLVCVYRRG